MMEAPDISGIDSSRSTTGHAFKNHIVKVIRLFEGDNLVIHT